MARRLGSYLRVRRPRILWCRSDSKLGTKGGRHDQITLHGVCVKSLSRVHDRSRLKSCHTPPCGCAGMYTGRFQTPLPERACRFESCHPHKMMMLVGRGAVRERHVSSCMCQSTKNHRHYPILCEMIRIHQLSNQSRSTRHMVKQGTLWGISSDGKSTCLARRGSWVRVPHAPPIHVNKASKHLVIEG